MRLYIVLMHWSEVVSPKGVHPGQRAVGDRDKYHDAIHLRI